MTTLPTPDDVLAYWIGEATHDAEAAAAKNKLWFVKSVKTDADIAERFLPLVTALTTGLAYDWAEQGPHARLAAIIGIDQFCRNLFRGDALAFKHDPIALGLCKDGLMRDEDKGLSEIERKFFYLPLEHSERMADQDLAISLYTNLAADARPGFKPICEKALDYARQHRDVIARFGRFPHRNKILGRTDTAEEKTFNQTPGTGF